MFTENSFQTYTTYKIDSFYQSTNIITKKVFFLEREKNLLFKFSMRQLSLAKESTVYSYGMKIDYLSPNSFMWCFVITITRGHPVFLVRL